MLRGLFAKILKAFGRGQEKVSPSCEVYSLARPSFEQILQVLQVGLQLREEDMGNVFVGTIRSVAVTSGTSGIEVTVVLSDLAFRAAHRIYRRMERESLSVMFKPEHLRPLRYGDDGAVGLELQAGYGPSRNLWVVPVGHHAWRSATA